MRFGVNLPRVVSSGLLANVDAYFEALTDYRNGNPGPIVQRVSEAAFLATGGAQCGICTPGMLMAARVYLDAGGGPDEDAIREAIAGNLCRCTGYTKIVEAIALAAETARAGRARP